MPVRRVHEHLDEPEPAGSGLGQVVLGRSSPGHQRLYYAGVFVDAGLDSSPACTAPCVEPSRARRARSPRGRGRGSATRDRARRRVDGFGSHDRARDRLAARPRAPGRGRLGRRPAPAADRRVPQPEPARAEAAHPRCRPRADGLCPLPGDEGRRRQRRPRRGGRSLPLGQARQRKAAPHLRARALRGRPAGGKRADPARVRPRGNRVARVAGAVRVPRGRPDGGLGHRAGHALAPAGGAAVPPRVGRCAGVAAARPVLRLPELSLARPARAGRRPPVDSRSRHPEAGRGPRDGRRRHERLHRRARQTRTWSHFSPPAAPASGACCSSAGRRPLSCSRSWSWRPRGSDGTRRRAGAASPGWERPARRSRSSQVPRRPRSPQPGPRSAGSPGSFPRWRSPVTSDRPEPRSSRTRSCPERGSPSRSRSSSPLPRSCLPPCGRRRSSSAASASRRSTSRRWPRRSWSSSHSPAERPTRAASQAARGRERCCSSSPASSSSSPPSSPPAQSASSRGCSSVQDAAGRSRSGSRHSRSRATRAGRQSPSRSSSSASGSPSSPRSTARR